MFAVASVACVVLLVLAGDDDSALTPQLPAAAATSGTITDVAFPEESGATSPGATEEDGPDASDQSTPQTATSAESQASAAEHANVTPVPKEQSQDELGDINSFGASDAGPSFRPGVLEAALARSVLASASRSHHIWNIVLNGVAVQIGALSLALASDLRDPTTPADSAIATTLILAISVTALNVALGIHALAATPSLAPHELELFGDPSAIRERGQPYLKRQADLSRKGRFRSVIQQTITALPFPAVGILILTRNGRTDLHEIIGYSFLAAGAVSLVSALVTLVRPSFDESLYEQAMAGTVPPLTEDVQRSLDALLSSAR